MANTDAEKISKCVVVEHVFDYNLPMFSAVVDELVVSSDDELNARIEANELERRRLDAEMSAALAVAKARNLHGVGGHRTMAAYCRATLNWSTAEAGRRLGLAQAVNDVAGLGDAWMAGRFGYSQALKLSMTNGNQRVADRLPEFAPALLEHAEKMPYSSFTTVVDHFVSRADEDGAQDDRDQAIEGRSAHIVDVGGQLDVRACGGDGLVTDELIQIHQAFADAEYHADVEARRSEHGEKADALPLPRTDAQRSFDALVTIFRAADAASKSGLEATAAVPVVNIVIDSHTWGQMLLAAEVATNTDLAGNPLDPFTALPIGDLDSLLGDLTKMKCATESGVPLHTHDVMRAALAGQVRRVVMDSDRVIIDMGRRQRLFTGSARVAAKLLVERCERFGCELPAEWCDVDHVEEWDRDRGRTDQVNSAILCEFDNNDKHRSGWRTRRATNGCSYTFGPDGTIRLPVGARPPDFTEDLTNKFNAGIAKILNDHIYNDVNNESSNDSNDGSTDDSVDDLNDDCRSDVNDDSRGEIGAGLDDDPERIAWLTSLARRRVDALARTG